MDFFHEEMDECVVVYIDDIYSKIELDHARDLKRVLG